MQDLALLLSQPNVISFFTSLKPLLMFIVGIVIYSLFVFKFYKFVGKRDIFKLNLNQYNKRETGLGRAFLGSVFYLLEYAVVFPLFVFFWFLVFVALLAFMSKTANVESILLMAMALIASIRITSYFSEDLSKELAKTLPFALLAIFLSDIEFFSLGYSLNVFNSLSGFGELILFYFLFVVILEFILRLIYLISLIFSPKKFQEELKEEELAEKK